MKTKFSLLLATMLALTGCAEPPEVSSTPAGDSSANSSSTTETQTGNATSSSTQTEDQGGEDSETSTSTSIVENMVSMTFQDNKNILDYKKVSNGTNDFLLKNELYKVGDDNEFAINPITTYMDANLEEYPYTDGYTVTLERKVDEEFKSLTKDEIALYVENINKDNAGVNFSKEAVGQIFKITYLPALIPSGSENINKAKSLIVEVRDGYNVTKVEELSYISNDTQDIPRFGESEVKNAKTEWDAYKTAHELDVDYVPNGIYLHTNLNIGIGDFPDAYLVNDYETAVAEYVGKLNDEVELYQRNLKDGEKFEICGNYFTINCGNVVNPNTNDVIKEGVPLIALSGNKDKGKDYQISHSQLFFFRGETSEVSGPNENAPEVTVSDMRIIGNTPKSESLESSGGLIFAKPYQVKYTVRNCRTLKWFITYYGELTKSPILFESCYATDAFNTFAYLYGCPDVTIKDCVMRHAGGPCIIQDHVDRDNKDVNKQYIPNTKVINSKLESFVEGTEGWFTIMGAAAMVPQITAMNKIFNGFFGSSFLFKDADATGANANKDFFNIIAVNKAPGEIAPDKADLRINGSISFDDKVTYDYGAADPIFKKAYSEIAPQGAPIVKNSASIQGDIGYGPMSIYGYAAFLPTPEIGMGAYNPLVKNTPAEGNPNPYAIGMFAPASKDTLFNAGDTFTLYFLGMMLTFQYSPTIEGAVFHSNAA